MDLLNACSVKSEFIDVNTQNTKIVCARKGKWNANTAVNYYSIVTY
jgi:hypothetical protein